MAEVNLLGRPHILACRELPWLVQFQMRNLLYDCALKLIVWSLFTPLKGLRKRVLILMVGGTFSAVPALLRVLNQVSVWLCWIKCYDRHIKWANPQSSVFSNIERSLWSNCLWDKSASLSFTETICMSVYVPVLSVCGLLLWESGHVFVFTDSY